MLRNNEPDLFPSLRSLTLESIVRTLAKKYTFVDRIVLYRAPASEVGASYFLFFDITEEDRAARAAWTLVVEKRIISQLAEIYREKELSQGTAAEWLFATWLPENVDKEHSWILYDRNEQQQLSTEDVRMKRERDINLDAAAELTGLLEGADGEHSRQERDAIASKAKSHVDYGFFREGPTWKIVYNGKSLTGLKGKGFEYIHYLVKHPNSEYHTDELAKESLDSMQDANHYAEKENQREPERIAVNSLDHRDIADPKYIKEMKDKLNYLNQELREANESNDPHRIQMAEEEIEEYKAHFAQMLKPRGQSRKFADATTRTMNRITKSIERALKTVKKHDESTWNHFNSALSPIHAYFLSYTPDREISWITE
nr:hypothetical protein 16 [Desulfobacterales bacterium]